MSNSKLGRWCYRRPTTLGIRTTGGKTFGSSGRSGFGSISRSSHLHRPQLHHGVCTQKQSSNRTETCQSKELISDALLVATYLSLGVPLSLAGLCVPTRKMRPQQPQEHIRLPCIDLPYFSC